MLETENPPARPVIENFLLAFDRRFDDQSGPCFLEVFKELASGKR